MRSLLKLALVALVFATPLHAAEAEPDVTAAENPEAPVAEPTPVAAPELDAAPVAPELRLDPVQVEQRVVADEAEAAQWPPRGSFWWLVGVIVVAGVLLAVLL